MAHYLKTVNPDAAAAIGKVEHEQPPIGTTLQYYARPGEGRGGKPIAPMVVTHHRPDGRIGGVVTYDSNDRNDVEVWQRSDANPFPAWDWVVASPASAPVLPAVGEITRQHDEQMQLIDQQIAQLTGERDQVLQFARDLDTFEASFKVLKERVDAMRVEMNKGGQDADLVQRVELLEAELGLDKKPPPSKAKGRK